MSGWSRRAFLRGTAVLVGGVLVVGCGAHDADSEQPLRLSIARGDELSDQGSQALWQGAELALATAGRGAEHLLILSSADAPVIAAAASGRLPDGVDALLAPPSSDAGACSPSRAGGVGAARLPGSAAAMLYLRQAPRAKAPRGRCPGTLACWLGPTAMQLARPLGTWARRELGQRAGIWRVDDAWGSALAAAFRHGFRSDRSIVVGEQGPPSTVEEAAAVLDAWRPELLFVAAPGDALKVLVDRYAAAGLWRRARLVTVADAPAVDQLVGLGEAARGLIVSTGWLPALSNQASTAFVHGFRARFAVEPTALAVQAYEATRLLLAAAEQHASEPSDRTALLTVLETVQLDGPRGSVRLDLTHGGVVQDVAIVELKQRRAHIVPVALERIPAVGPEG